MSRWIQRHCAGFAVNVSERQDFYPEAEGLVMLRAPSTGFSHLTPDEARKLAAILVEGADAADRRERA